MIRDAIHIAPEPLIVLRDGKAIYSVIADGEIADGTDRDRNAVVKTFREGSLVLVGNGARIILGPIDPQAAFDLARSVCNCEPIGLTGSQHIHILATALLGLAACMPAAPDPSAPAIAEVA